jgi:hypothetical protein
VKQVFWQTWRDLVFVHWEVNPDLLASLLPPQLEPDLFNGKAYIGLVPFRMTDIRHVFLPAVPGCSATLETNVRTYVKRRSINHEPIPAVWFFSLEASSALAVLIARLGFGLPYFKASMSFDQRVSADGKSWITARSTRRWPPPVPAHSLVEVEFPSDTPLQPAQPGTLEHFLVERYALYSRKRGQLRYARVQHSPYQIAAGRLLNVDAGLLEAAGISLPSSTEAPLVHRAADVVVRIGKIERLLE